MARVDRTSLARRIKARRIELGMTQREIAGEDFTRGFISQIENGIIDPSLKSLELIAHRLGVPISYFLDHTDSVDPVVVENHIREVYELLDSEPAKAEPLATSAIDAAGKLDNPNLLARAQAALGWVFYHCKQFAEAKAEFIKAAEFHRRAGNLLLSAHAYNSAGSAAHRAQQYEDAVKLYENALELCTSLEEASPVDVLRTQVNLGLLLSREGDVRKGVKILQDVLIAEEEQQDYYRYGDVHIALGSAYCRLGEIDKAVVHYKEAEKFSLAVNDHAGAAHAALNCGIAYEQKHDYAKAHQCFEKAHATYVSLNDSAAVATANAELARLAWHEGEFATAASLCNTALASLEQGQEKGRMHILRGRILVQQQDLQAALAAFTTGLEVLDALGHSAAADATEACFEIGNLLLQLGSPQEASTYLARAATSYRNMTR